MILVNIWAYEFLFCLLRLKHRIVDTTRHKVSPQVSICGWLVLGRRPRAAPRAECASMLAPRAPLQAPPAPLNSHGDDPERWAGSRSLHTTKHSPKQNKNGSFLDPQHYTQSPGTARKAELGVNHEHHQAVAPKQARKQRHLNLKLREDTDHSMLGTGK